ncbi:MAG: CPBP family intramembrane metalloprotease, partial [Prolixibacteraceae bacterium]|nr:CPBP family intramembrane metalloprotease [Prolixibacteraceae bacterium]
MKNIFFILFVVWTLLGAALIYGVSVSESNDSILSLAANVISISPLFGLMLALGSLKASNQFNNWLNEDKNSLYYLAGGITFLFALPGLITGTFNPYYTVIFSLIVFMVFGVLKQAKDESFRLNWSDIAVWIVLWILFDLRWYMEILPAVDSISYTWWSIAVSVIAIIGWYGFRGADIGFNLVPKIKDLYITLIALIVIMALVIPPGLATGFLTFSIPESYDIPKLAIHFIGLFLTVALPEELFFRGILLRGLDKVFAKRWIPLVVSSLAFGLMHWNNVGELSTQIIYVSLASVAGLGYGWAYRKSGNNL